MVKRTLSIILVILLLSVPSALAQGLCSLEEYFSTYDIAKSEWSDEAKGCVLTYAPADDVTISLCAEDGQLLAISVTAEQDSEIEKYALDALLASGVLSEEQLKQVLEDMDNVPGTLHILYLEGELREGIYLCMAGEADDFFWQPMHGGKKHHKSEKCSGMDVPRLITQHAAEIMGFGPCKKCMRG